MSEDPQPENATFNSEGKIIASFTSSIPLMRRLFSIFDAWNVSLCGEVNKSHFDDDLYYHIMMFDLGGISATYQNDRDEKTQRARIKNLDTEKWENLDSKPYTLAIYEPFKICADFRYLSSILDLYDDDFISDDLKSGEECSLTIFDNNIVEIYISEGLFEEDGIKISKSYYNENNNGSSDDDGTYKKDKIT